MNRLAMIFMLGFVVLLLQASIVAAQFSEAGVQKLDPPGPAPDFTLNKLGGGKVSLKYFRRKIIILNTERTYSKYSLFTQNIGNFPYFFLHRIVKTIGRKVLKR